jgi:peroxiredoxin Q/BCP
MPIQAGTPAPNFSLDDESGTRRSLSDYRGARVVLYFYPKDDTPGCTTESCNFRDDYSSYVDASIVILGVSPDSVKSHSKFKEKFKLPFPLLADLNHAVCESYGVWGEKKYMGKEYMGVLRTTFLIDDNGMISHVFENVRPDEHSAEILAMVKL